MSKALERLATAILEGNMDASPDLVQKALDEGHSPADVLSKGMVVGMNEIGELFRAGEVFVPDVLWAAEAMKAGLVLLRPLLIESGAEMLGTVVIATVAGDLHDIGKNLVGMLCEGAGFTVVDLGFDVSVDKIVEAVKEHKADVVGLSALLTTTMRVMSHTIKALEEAGLRDQVKVMVGGAPVDEVFAMRIGADGYGSNAPAGVDLAKKLVGAA